MKPDKCAICGGDLKKMIVRITDDKLGINKDFSAEGCENCEKCFVEKEAISLYKIQKYADVLSNDAYKLLAVCVMNTNYTTALVSEHGRRIERDRLADLSGFNPDRVDVLLDELWEHRLVMTVRTDDRILYFVNLYYLDFCSLEDFKTIFLFWPDFLRGDKKYIECARRRNLRKRNLINDFTEEDRKETLEYFENKCALTGKDVPLHMDHVIPLAVGHGGTTKSNMLPVWQRINTSKGAKNIFEWYKESGERFGVIPEKFDKAIKYLADLNGMSVDEYREYVYRCHENPNDILTKECV